jgi:hypothetical protein
MSTLRNRIIRFLLIVTAGLLPVTVVECDSDYGTLYVTRDDDTNTWSVDFWWNDYYYDDGWY